MSHKSPYRPTASADPEVARHKREVDSAFRSLTKVINEFSAAIDELNEAVAAGGGGGGGGDHGALAGLGDDDHTQYQLRSEQGVANGYPSLDANARLVEPAQVLRVTGANLSAGAVPDGHLIARSGTSYVGVDPDTLGIETVELLIDLRDEPAGAVPASGTLVNGLAYTAVTPTNTTFEFGANGAAYSHETGGSTGFGTSMAQLNGCGHIRFQLGDIYELMGIDETWDLLFQGYWSDITWHGIANRVSLHLRGDADTTTAATTNRLRGLDLVGDGTVDSRNSTSTVEYSAAPASTVDTIGLSCRFGGIPTPVLGRWSEGDGTLAGVPTDFAIQHMALPVHQITHRDAWLAFIITSNTTAQTTLAATLQQIRVSANRNLP